MSCNKNAHKFQHVTIKKSKIEHNMNRDTVEEEGIFYLYCTKCGDIIKQDVKEK